MKQVLAFPLALLIAAPGSAQALGLGNIERKSALNQPFNATIELVGPQAEDLDSLTVRLADSERFLRAGIERSAVLSQLHFEVVQAPQGSDYIKVTSTAPIREPYLDFLVEVSWANGKIYREYTVLLDPPNYVNLSGQAATRTAGRTDDLRRRTLRVDSVTAAGRKSQDAESATPNFRGESYGPVRANETLWPIAEHVRPNQDISVQQMMLALLRANPEAFVAQNVNTLKKGAVLHVPPANELSNITQSEALSEVRRQFADWRGHRGSALPTPRPRSQHGLPMTGNVPASGSETDGQLKLLSPATAGSQAAPSNGDPQPTSVPGGKASSQDVALAHEALDSQRQENADLKSKLSETDETLKLLQHQIELKNQELANLQAKLAGDASKPQASGVATTSATESSADGKAETIVPPSVASDPTPVAVPQPTVLAKSNTEPAAAQSVADKKPEEPSAEAAGMWTEIFDVVPGGIFTAIGALALAIGGGVFAFLRKRRAAADEASSGFSDSDVPQVFVARGGNNQVASADDADAETPLERTHPGENEAPVEAAETDEMAAAARTSPGGQRVRFENDSTLGLSGDLASDPLAEVNVYLAYEQFDQAEALVQEAIRTHPQVHEYKLRLLEVYYSAGNQRAYESFAKTLRDAVGGNGPLWESALAMWQELSPARAMFDTSGHAPVQPQVRGGNQFVDLTKDSGLASPVEVDLSAEMAAHEGLDFDLNMAELAAANSDLEEAPDLLDLTSAAPNRPMDFDLVDLTAAAENDDEMGVLDLSGEASDEGSLDSMFDISGGDDPLNRTIDHAPEPVAGLGNTLDVSFDLRPREQVPSPSLLDVTANVGITSTEHGDILDLTASGLDSTPKTVELSGQVPDGVSSEFDILDLTHSGTEQDRVRDVKASAGTIELEPVAAPVLDLPFPSAGLELSQDLAAGDATLTDAHEIPDIDFSLSTAAIVQAPVEPIVTAELAPIEDDSKIFEELGWSLEDSGDDEARLHVNVAESETDLSLQLEQDPTSTAGDFLDIFDGGSSVPVEVLSGATADAEPTPSEDAEHEDQRSVDSVEAKLSLAKAYLEVGDTDGAQPLLDEVDHDGSSKQKKEAGRLRKRMKK